MLPVVLRRTGRFTRAVWASPVAVLLLSVSAERAAAQPGPAEPIAAPQVAAPVSIPIYTVADCIHVAFDRQPALAAARASLAAKNSAYRGLNNPVTGAFIPGVNIRRQQACRGLSAAQAELMQAGYDTSYSVTRTYFTAIYARMQLDVSRDVSENLKFYRDRVKDIVAQGASPEFNQGTVDRLNIYFTLAQAKLVEADEGINRATSALREAMGVGRECSTFQLADLVLPEITTVPDRCEIINAALDRRGELIQVMVAADVARLEVDAQGRVFLRPTARTFASGADIHSQSVPPGERNGAYRPGAIGPEMPTNLAGNRSARVDQANAYASRAASVVEKTRELIILEAEDAFLKWVEANRKVNLTRDAARSARKLAKQTRDDFAGGGKVKQEDLLLTDVLAGQAQASFNEALYQQILALANLERITAGGFVSGLTCTAP